jgi:hypothetical protein
MSTRIGFHVVGSTATFDFQVTINRVFCSLLISFAVLVIVSQGTAFNSYLKGVETRLIQKHC